MAKDIAFKLEFLSDSLSDYGDVDGDGEKEVITTRLLRIVILDKKSLDISKEYLVIPKLAEKKKRKKKEEDRLLSGFEAGDTPLLIRLVDVDGDGRKEIFVARADNILFAITSEGKEIWSYEFPEMIREIIPFADDSIRENALIVTEKGSVFLIRGKRGKVSVKEILRDFIIEDGCVGDINRDNFPELIFVTRHGEVLIYDHKLTRLGAIELGTYLDSPVIKVGDLNGDGEKEIVVGDKNGWLIICKGNKVVKTFRNIGEIISLHIHDVNNDGIQEIILATYEGLLKILNLNEVIFEKMETPEIIYDIDGDGDQEVIYRYWRKVSYKKMGKDVWSIKWTSWISSLCISDMDGDGIMEILITSLDGNAFICNINGEIIWRKRFSSPPMVCAVEDFDGDGKKEILLLGVRSLYLLEVK